MIYVRRGSVQKTPPVTISRGTRRDNSGDSSKIYLTRGNGRAKTLARQRNCIITSRTRLPFERYVRSVPIFILLSKRSRRQPIAREKEMCSKNFWVSCSRSRWVGSGSSSSTCLALVQACCVETTPFSATRGTIF